MLGSILGGLVVIVLIVLRIVLSRPARRAVDSAIKDHTIGNMTNNLDLYEQMRAARARGDEVKPPSAFN